MINLVTLKRLMFKDWILNIPYGVWMNIWHLLYLFSIHSCSLGSFGHFIGNTKYWTKKYTLLNLGKYSRKKNDRMMELFYKDFFLQKRSNRSLSIWMSFKNIMISSYFKFKSFLSIWYIYQQVEIDKKF